MFSFEGGTWSVVGFNRSANAPDQARAISEATTWAKAIRQPIMIYWSGVHDGEALCLPWGIVTAKGGLLMLTKTQIKQAR